MRNLLLLLLYILIIPGCKKDDTPQNQQANNAVKNAALLEGTWKVSAVVSDKAFDVDGNGTAETDLYSASPNCARQFALTFISGGTGYVRPDCVTAERAMTWNLTNDGNTINYAMSGTGTLQEDIVILNATTLKTTSKLQRNGETYTLSNTYTKQ
jgi:hypothetical protein